MNLFGGAAALTIDGEAVEADVEKLDIPIHAFDLIVADECHRGYSAKERAIWRDTLDHFDAIKIGLTATPAAHTMAYFENLALPLRLRAGGPRGLPRRLRRREGQLRRADQRRLPRTKGSRSTRSTPRAGAKQLDLLEDERAFDATEVEREITAPDSNRKILEELKSYADEHRGRARPLPQDADLRRQRPAAHLARRPAGRPGPRRLRPRRGVRRQDHRPRRPAAAAHPRVPQPARTPASWSRSTCSRPASTSRTWSSSSSCGRSSRASCSSRCSGAARG